MNEARTQFDYLLNAFERASQYDAPADHGYADKRRALYAYVRDLEARATPPAPAQPAIITPDVPPLDIHSAAARIWQALQGVDLRKQDPVPVIAQALADAAIQHVGAPAQPASAEPVALGSRAETKSDALGSANRAKVDAEQGWRRECDDTDAVLRLIGLDPEQCRTDGGSLNVPKIGALLRDRATALAYLCPAGCGCTWRDNGDGSMSLYGPSSRSCAVCETLPLSKLLPLYAAAPPTPAQPADACWCESCDIAAHHGMRTRMSLCPQCGNKRCPRATHHDNACTGSNEPGQPGSSYAAPAQPVAGAEPVAKVRVHRTGGNAGIAWSAVAINDHDSLPLMPDGALLYAAPTLPPAFSPEQERAMKIIQDAAAALSPGALIPQPATEAKCPHIRSSGTGDHATNWCALNGPPAAPEPSEAEVAAAMASLHRAMEPAAWPSEDEITDALRAAAAARNTNPA